MILIRLQINKYTATFLGQRKYMCLGFPYLPYFFALKNAYPNIFMVILA